MIDVRTSQRCAGMVQRYHTWPTLQKQTVADHTFHLIRIYCILYGPPEKIFLEYMLAHDMAEVVTGDIPFGAKSPDMVEALRTAEHEALRGLGMTAPSLTSEEKRRIKLCDLLEMYEFGEIERELGNRFALRILKATCSAVYEIALTAEKQKIHLVWKNFGVLA